MRHPVLSDTEPSRAEERQVFNPETNTYMGCPTRKRESRESHLARVRHLYLIQYPKLLCVGSHACYFVELPTPPGAARGVRIIFDPVFSNRCSPSDWVGPARFTGTTSPSTIKCDSTISHVSLTPTVDTPCKVEDIPAVDAIVLSVRLPPRCSI
jgi:hypothetical protein